MRIAVLASGAAVNTNYRGLPLVSLRNRGHDVTVDLSGVAKPGIGSTVDVVHIYRYHDDVTRRIAAEWRKAGVGIVWDNDDDLTSGEGMQDGREPRPSLRTQKERSDMIRMLRLAHVVTTTSEELARQYREWGAADVRVVGNFLPDAFLVSERRSHSDVVVGWTAGAEHYYDLERLDIRATLRRLLERYEEVMVVGIGMDLGLPRVRYAHKPTVQYADLPSEVSRFDIGIAPLADIPFNRARSDVKLKEYAAAGAAWLASPVGPYRGYGARQGGHLVPDDGWDDALGSLVANARERRKLAKRGRNWAAGQTVSKNLRQWEAALRAALRLAA